MCITNNLRERKLRMDEMTMETTKRQFKSEREVERRKEEQERRLLQVMANG